MRQGSTFRRCTRCQRRASAKDKQCAGCGHDRFCWGYIVDLAPPGAPRDQRRKSGFATKAEALDDMNGVQSDNADGTYVRPSKITVGAYLATWMEKGCGGVRPSTRKSYECIVRLHLIPRLGQRLLQKLDRRQIEQLYDSLRTDGYTSRLTAAHRQRLEDVAGRYRLALQAGRRPTALALAAELGRHEHTVRYQVRRCRELGLIDTKGEADRKRTVRGLSPKTIWNVHICLRAALYDAIEQGLLKTNPAKGVLKEPDEQAEMETWTAEELRAFLDSTKRDPLFPLYRLAAYSGMRRGELLGLRWADVKFTLSSVSVQQQLGTADDDDEVEDGVPVLVPVKTRSSRRSIKLDEETIKILRQHRAAQEVEREELGAAYHSHDLVFASIDGTALDPDVVSDHFDRLGRCAEVKRIRFHDLRHTHATLLLEAGVDITVVSKRLGHASVQITADRYAHVTERLQQDAAQRLSTYLDQDKPPDN